MFCPACGKVNPDTASSCLQCGAPLPGAGAMPAQQPYLPQQPAYTPPSQQTAYTPPSQPSAYAPPVSHQPAYTPPSQSAYAPPVQQQPAYTPPSQPAYAPPVQQQPAYKPPSQPATYSPPSQPPAYTSPAQQPVYNQQQPAYNPQQPYGQQPAYGQQNSYDGQGYMQQYGAPAPKKKKTGLIIGISAAGVAIVAFLIILFTVILPGSSDEGQIKSIVKAVESAMNSGTIDPIRKYLPPEMTESEKSYLQSSLTSMKAAYGASGVSFRVTISMGPITFNADKTAAEAEGQMIVTANGMTYPQTSTMNFKKINGKWYIAEM